MAETYTIKLYAYSSYPGCSSEEEVSLSDYGYTDEEWDALSLGERERLLDRWGEEYFWNDGYGYNAEVNRG